VSKKKHSRLAYVSASALVLALALLAAPVAACGCGIYIPEEGEARVRQERALIVWDAGQEDIVLELGVQGSSAEAAWIFPVPSPATAQLGDARIFETLQELTKPRTKKVYDWFPNLGLTGAVGGGAPGGVQVLNRQTLGPFDVSSLAASDANALSDWLTTNGYKFPDGLSRVLEPYVAQHWYYVAARLSPSVSGETLTGRLDPLRVTFASDKIVYPMRATALATGDLSVFLYVLADHRVTKQAAFGSSHVSFADWVEPAALTADSPLAPFITRKLFLTKFEERIFDPAQVDDDYEFSLAVQDEIYHEVEIEHVSDFAGVPLFLWACCLCLVPLVLLALLGIGRWVLLKRRQN
jgi:hypothetical protein